MHTAALTGFSAAIALPEWKCGEKKTAKKRKRRRRRRWLPLSYTTGRLHWCTTVPRVRLLACGHPFTIRGGHREKGMRMFAILFSAELEALTQRDGRGQRTSRRLSCSLARQDKVCIEDIPLTRWGVAKASAMVPSSRTAEMRWKC